MFVFSFRPKASHSQVLFASHSGRVASLAVSPCGRFVATGQEGKTASAIVWDPATGHVRKVLSFVGRSVARVWRAILIFCDLVLYL